MNLGQVASFSASLGREPFVVELDNIVVLSMNHHDAVILRHLLHRELDAPHVQPDSRPLGMRGQNVGGKNLGTGKSLLDYVADLVKRLERLRTKPPHVK